MNNKIVLFESLEEAKSLLKHREMRKIKISGHYFGLVRYLDNFFVFEDKCPHMSYSLIQDQIGLKPQIVCDWHNYIFQLSDGSELENRCRKLKVEQLKQNSSGELYFNSNLDSI